MSTKESTGRKAGESETPTADSVLNNRINTVYAPNAIIGSYLDRAESVTGNAAVIGRLDPDKVRATAKAFLEPEGFAAAAKRLAAERIVVLEGRRGLGKRTSAICLLDRVGAKSVEVLNPLITLAELAEVAFEPGRGYLVCDHRGEAESADAEFNWLRIREKVREAETEDEPETWLVVTVNRDDGRTRVQDVARFDWHAPDRKAFLHRHLDGETVAQITAELPEYCSMSVLAEICRAPDRKAALAELRDRSIEPVVKWFATGHPRDDIIDLATLCFLNGAGRRFFEQHRASFAAYLESAWPPAGSDQAQPVETVLPQDRKRQVIEDGLVQVTKEDHTGRILLEFASPAYAKAVMEQLQANYGRLWTAVGDWLEEIVTAGGEALRTMVAVGLCDLARTDREQVETDFLEPWSRNELRWPGLETITYLLWLMSCDEELAPAALFTAKRWASSTVMSQRWTAGIVFRGVLGLRYPDDAAKQLWHIAQNGTELEQHGIDGLAGLFALQIAQDEPVRPVTDLLDQRLAKYFGRGGDRSFLRLQRLAMDAVLAVLTIQETGATRTSVARLLAERPAASRPIARFWARTLQDRRYRREAMLGLAETLAGLRNDAGEPEEAAYRLVGHLNLELPVREHGVFRRDFTAYISRRDSPGEGTLGDILRTALNRDSAEGERKR